MPKKSGGPITSAGKARSAQNAIKYGITSNKLASAQESQLVHGYIEELSDFYGPTSPLEKLQIERIALCRAKLAHLYEVEQIRLQLAARDLEQNPEIILERGPYLSDVAKGMALEYLHFGEICLPCHLTKLQLQTLVYEIQNLKGTITSLADLKKYLPRLCQFLATHPDKSMSSATTIPDKLRLLNEDLNRCLDRGANYMEHTWALLAPILEKERAAKEALGKAVPEEENELDKYLRQTQERRDLERGKSKVAAPAAVVEPIFPSHALILEQLKSLVSILSHLTWAEEALSEYEKTKDLLQRSVTLPVQESDLLMRYQTTLERRLSSAIGELLELQRRKSP